MTNAERITRALRCEDRAAEMDRRGWHAEAHNMRGVARSWRRMVANDLARKAAA